MIAELFFAALVCVLLLLFILCSVRQIRSFKKCYSCFYAKSNSFICFCLLYDCLTDYDDTCPDWEPEGKDG